jgi:hypothetical protein
MMEKVILTWGLVVIVHALNYITYAVFGVDYIFLFLSGIWAGIGIIILHRVIK